MLLVSDQIRIPVGAPRKIKEKIPMIRISPAILALLIPTAGLAQQYQKNSLPCVQNLCIGDGLSELGKIKWDRAKSDFSITGKPDYVGSHPLTASSLASVRSLYRGDLTKAAPYLSYQAFDGTALALLPNITAACGTQELKGTFVSEGGNPTIVKIALLSDKKDVGIQRWTVTSISRSFPSAVTQAQKLEIRRQLDERYDRFNFSHGIRKGVDATYGIHDEPMLTGSYGFSLILNIPINEVDRERSHPACGGQKKVSIE